MQPTLPFIGQIETPYQRIEHCPTAQSSGLGSGSVIGAHAFVAASTTQSF